MLERGLYCLVAYGSDGVFRDCSQNLRYLTNTYREGYVLFPLEGDPTLYSFENGLEPVWVADWRGAVPSYSGAIAGRLRDLGLGHARIGIVGISGFFAEQGGFPHKTYVSLERELPDCTLEDATALVEDARRIKSAEEITCLELGCQIMERVLEAIGKAAGVGARDLDVRAAILDTLFRNGADQGAMLLYCQGKDVMHGGQRGARFEPGLEARLEHGDVILIELDVPYCGYKAQFNQAVVIGDPDEEWTRIFDTATRSFWAGLEVLRDGVTVGELEEAFLAPIHSAGFSFGNPAFHGLGLGLEAPVGTYPRANYKADPSVVLAENMVLEFEPHPTTLDGRRGASVGCPVLIQADGARMLPRSWSPEPLIVR
jgi:Xaa-Pro aminopeptidase